jgi:hypothetical protein
VDLVLETPPVADFNPDDALENDPKFNPYQAPKVVPVRGPWLDSGGQGIWRDGNLLIMEKTATLPDLCVKCAADARGYRLKRDLSWHPSLYYLLIIVCNILVYAIVALIVRKTARIYVGLCDHHRRRRLRGILIGWFAALGGIAAIVAGSAYLDSGWGPLIGVGAGLILFGLVAGLLFGQVITAKKIDDRFVWMKGCGLEFLAQFPDFDAPLHKSPGGKVSFEGLGELPR